MITKRTTKARLIKTSHPFAKLLRNWEFLLLCFPVLLQLFIFHYLPIFGVVIAFKDFRYDLGILGSPWVGLDNFKFFFLSQDAWRLARNTIGYSISFLALGTLSSLVVALMLYQVKSRFAIKYFQSSMILPHFISMVIVSYLVYILLDPNKGIMTQILLGLGANPIDWYSEPKHWPVILNLVHIWKSVGMGSVVYYAALIGLDKSLFEAATIDGAGKWQQTFYISIPSILPIVSILTILGLGGIFSGDFGMFYQVPRNIGVLYPTTDVIDTYVYRALRSGYMTKAAAVGLFQSLVGCVTIITVNLAVKKISPDNSLF